MAALKGQDKVQTAGKALLLYTYSLMKTGEAHELNNEAWLRPIEKLQDTLQALFKMERQALTLVIAEGVAKVNSHALWLDKNLADQAQEIEQWLARREAGGIIFKKKSKDKHLRLFFSLFARHRAPEGTKDVFKDICEVLESEGIVTLKLAPQPLRLDGVGTGVRGVAALWHYAKGAAAMSEILRLTPLEVRAAKRVAQELVDTCTVEQDLLTALPLLATGEEPHRRAVDVGVLVAAVTRGLGMSRTECAELTTMALLHAAGYAYENPDPAEFTMPEVAGTLALRQLLEGSAVSPTLATRVAAAMEHALGPDRQGPPYLAGPPRLLPTSQLVALCAHYLSQVRGAGKRRGPG